ncbi:MAG: hypothetical protein IJ881_02350, partial [Neisseriaceae bacterium]|nr:hypothetical protein [Neisseriaceae bacterium]
KKQAKQSPQASTKDDELVKQLCKPDFGAKYEQAKYGNIKMNDIFIEPEQQENTMKISNLYKDEDGFAVNMRQFNDGDYDYSVFYRDTFLKSFRSPEYAIKAIHQNKTALFEEYHRMTYRPSHTENGVTYFTGGFTYLNEKQENTIKQDTFGLPEKPVHIDLDTPYIVVFPDDIEPNDPNANKTLGELMKENDSVMWDAEFWGDRVGTGEMTVSENFITQVIETQRSEVLEEITTCGNVPFTKEHIEALYEREPELIKEVADDYATPEIKALAKEVVETAEIGLKKQAKQSPQASTKDDELVKQLCKPDFALRKAALNDPEISVNLLKRVIDNHKCPLTRKEAQAVLGQRQGGGVGVSQPQSNIRSIAGATPKAAAPTPKASMSM